MVTIALRSGGEFEHVHVKEDLTSQVDGYNTVFVTTFEYKPGTLIVFFDGLAMRSGTADDFVESGPKQFTWVNGVVPGSGPGQCEDSMFAYYERVLP